MGKATRRGVIAASAAAAALVIAPAAMAAPNIAPNYPDAADQWAIGHTGNASAFFRFASKNRVLTALFSAQETTGWDGGTAILASSADYSDALASAALAEDLVAPILLANADGSLDPQVAAYLATFDEVIIASGPGVIPESTKAALNAAGVDTIRVAGVNRYETAAALGVYTLVNSTEDVSSGVNFILADGLNFPDALASGPASAKVDNGVVLLTAGANGVPSFTAQFLAGDAISWSPEAASWLPEIIEAFQGSAANFNHQTVTVVGGNAKKAAEAGVLGNITEPVEYDDDLVGADRYETAVKVADKYFGSFPTYYTLASGQDFPDAVVAGGWAANADGPLVLTRNTALPAVTKAYLVGAADNGDRFVTFGGTGSVAPSVSEELAEAFNW